MGKFFQTTIFLIPLVLLTSIIYAYVGYGLERTEHGQLLILYGFLFLAYVVLCKSNLNFSVLTGIAILCRLVFILSIPNLSQDFYRFIWDGRLILEGFNPYLYTPRSFIENGIFPVSQSIELYNGMGELNGSHFTNYPPINQLCFLIAGIFGSKSIIGSVFLLKLIIIVADIGIIYFGRKLLKHLNFNERNIFWFILNPLVIIELTGNLHFEGVMLFFFIWGIYLLANKNYKLAAVMVALSIGTKLIPLMFLPLFFWFFIYRNNKKYNFKKLIGFYTVILFVTALLFLPFFSKAFISNYASTVGLWFQNFEFNASLYYIAREIGYMFRGYNEIAIIGKWSAAIVFLFIIALSLFRKNYSIGKLMEAMLFAFTVYLFTTTTVHPWYLITLILLSIFTNYKFPLVWSATIILSYLAYEKSGVDEGAVILLLEYLPVYAVFIWEMFFKEKQLSSNPPHLPPIQDQ